MDNGTALRLAQASFPNADIAKVSMSSVARLWAGMGSIYRVQCFSSSETKILMVKYIHPRLSSKKLSIGDKRKLDSYLVEANFYEQYAASLIHEHNVPLPCPYHVERQLEDASNPTIIICMSELPRSIPRELNMKDDENVGVVRWMAKFHAATWQSQHSNNNNNNSDGRLLQPTGSYWHLDTRPDEWKDMPRSGWQGRLKLAAKAIDERLKRDPLQCFVHGDCKDANILYYSHGNNGGGDDEVEMAFCDFQYTGHGPPSRDLSYFFCSSHVDDADEQDALLDIYHQDLTQLLKATNPTQTLPTRQQLEDSKELAFCDFCRFMCGWGFWGYDLSKQVTATLDKLDGGKALKSQDDYEEAVRRVFG